MRKELEAAVIGVNRHLKEKVREMDLIELLRNCHPLYRKEYARNLYHTGQITEAEMTEFTGPK